MHQIMYCALGYANCITYKLVYWEKGAKMRTATQNTRMNIALPEPLSTEFKELVPARKRNQFIVDAVDKEIRRLRLLKALEESFGAWSDEDYPDLATSEDVDAYVRKLRESWMPQFENESTIESITNG